MQHYVRVILENNKLHHLLGAERPSAGSLANWKMVHACSYDVSNEDVCVYVLNNTSKYNFTSLPANTDNIQHSLDHSLIFYGKVLLWNNTFQWMSVSNSRIFMLRTNSKRNFWHKIHEKLKIWYTTLEVEPG